MKARDATTTRALRSALAAIDNAGAVDLSQTPHPGQGLIAGAVAGLGAGEVARRSLPERQVVEIVRAEEIDRQSAADDYERLGQRERAAELRAEASVIRDVLYRD
jgi:uncharacterized protein YqeY